LGMPVSVLNSLSTMLRNAAVAAPAMPPAVPAPVQQPTPTQTAAPPAPVVNYAGAAGAPPTNGTTGIRVLEVPGWGTATA
jgi:hypothetical protein